MAAARNYTLPRRIWRCAPWSSNPLVRSSDRWEAAVRMLAVLLVIAAIPVAFWAGSAVAAARLHARAGLSTTVQATITGTPTQPADHGTTPAGRWQAPARWGSGPRSRSGTIAVGPLTRAGDRLPLWVGPDGRPVSPPESSPVSDGVDCGFIILTGTCLVSYGIALVTHVVLTRRRNSDWDRAWRVLSRPGQGRL